MYNKLLVHAALTKCHRSVDNNRNLFIYEGNTRRESYAYPRVRPSGTINGCINSKGEYYLNCGMFAQMIWMGRCIEDFIVDEPTDEINTAFDWGYYFDFLAAHSKGRWHKP